MKHYYQLKGYITEAVTRTRNVMHSHDYFATLLQQESLLVCGNNNVSHMNNYFPSHLSVFVRIFWRSKRTDPLFL